MPLPKQLLVLQRLTEVLQGITPANNYDYDLSQAVFRGRPLFGEGDPDTMLSILESPKPDIGIEAGDEKIARVEDWLLFLQGWAPEDRTNPTDPAYYLKAAVESRLSRIMVVKGNGAGLYPEHYMLPDASGKPLIHSLAVGPGVVRPPDAKVSSRAYFYLPLTVKLSTNVSEPYAT